MANTVYRVEHPADGQGPYNSHAPSYIEDPDDIKSAILEAHAWTDDRPGVLYDTGHRMEAADLCGFRTMRQLFRWFGGWLPILVRHGFRVAVYRHVEVVAESERQLVFRP